MTDKEEAGPVSGVSEEVHQPSTEAALGSNNPTGGGTESTCNDFNNLSGSHAGTSTVNSEGGNVEKLMELANDLVERGSKAIKDRDFAMATDCFSRALETSVAHYGELTPECVNMYYKYGCALLYKAQEEADPLGYVPKKDNESQEGSTRGVSDKNNLNCGSSTASISSTTAEEQKPRNQKGIIVDVSSEKDGGEDDEDTDEQDTAVDEDESDLDLAWKMLDIARAIVEKHSGDTMEKVKILTALAEVALEREIASKPSEAIPYCQEAISICKSRSERLTNELKIVHESVSSSAIAASDTSAIASSSGPTLH
ncbi:hypothetical protein SAY86_026284 [Trapa natans]|uniref:Uncharacterized protein n=1 Tax=Trapa natans TaxID=22666 RepID=A0AAN7KHM4_TRANT|nr:hypothetical protein SAY86_026284 [Trapa natans]